MQKVGSKSDQGLQVGVAKLPVGSDLSEMFPEKKEKLPLQDSKGEGGEKIQEKVEEPAKEKVEVQLEDVPTEEPEGKEEPEGEVDEKKDYKEVAEAWQLPVAAS